MGCSYSCVLREGSLPGWVQTAVIKTGRGELEKGKRLSKDHGSEFPKPGETQAMTSPVLTFY